MGLPQQGVGGPGGGKPGFSTKSNLGPGYVGVNPDDPLKSPVATIGPNGGPPTYTENPYANPPAPTPDAPPVAPPAAPPVDQTPGLLATPGPYETWAATHGGQTDNPSAAETLYGKYGSGLMNDPSNSESLYGKGIGQLNPYYDYASQIGTKAINDAAAAHGGFSSTALTQIGNLNANLRGQQAQQMAALAKQADDEKLARYGAGSAEAQASDTAGLNRLGAGASIYGAWQDREASRLTGALSSQMNLSDAQAKQVDSFYTNLLQAGKYDAEGINAALQAAGVDPNSAFAKDLISTGQMIGKAYATGK